VRSNRFKCRSQQCRHASPYTRAQQSIAPLAQRLGLPVALEPRLAERVLSATPLEYWREAIRQTFEDLDLAWPGGESSRTAMARGRAAVDALLTGPVRVVVVVTHGNLMTLILRSFPTQFGFQAGEHLSNPEVYCLEVAAERGGVTRTWVPPVVASGTSQGANTVFEARERIGTATCGQVGIHSSSHIPCRTKACS
jgi:2,3-bisphosphoglycerate-dependent phosphoglycerate mutase